MLVEGHDPPFAVLQRVGQTAGLRAVATVGAAPGMGVADVALTRIGDAQRTVDEMLDDRLRPERGPHSGDLRDRQFAGQHDLREAHVGQEAGLGRRADVALGRGVQLDRRQVEFEQAEILHDQGIDAGIPALPDQRPGRVQLGVVQDRVEGDEDARVKAVCEFDQRRDVADRIARVVSGAERRAADIDRVGAMKDRLAADLGGLGGREQFQALATVRCVHAPPTIRQATASTVTIATPEGRAAATRPTA